MKLLLACDGSDVSRSVQAELRWAGLPDEGELRVLAVTDAWLPPADERSTPPAAVLAVLQRLRREREERLAEQARCAESCAEQVRAILPRWRVSAEAVADAPAWAIIQQAERWPADLVLVGSHAHGPLSRLMLGSVSQKVLTECRRSVRVARPHAGDEQAPRILIAVDGSRDSRAAVAEVARRAWPAAARFRVLAIADYRMMASAPFLLPEIPEGDVAWARRIAENAAEQLSGAGRVIEIGEGVGDAKNEILRDAESWRADMLFLGARGMTRIERFLLGSVSTSVATRAKCSVEIVHPDPAPAAAAPP